MKPISKKTKRAVIDVIALVVGCFLYSAAVQMFTNPNKISIGGLTGIASALNYLWDLPIGLQVLAMNIPLYILSWKSLGKKFVLKTGIATVVLSVTLDLAEYLPVFTGDKLLAALAGGVGTGIGLGLIYSRGIATGGTDILAKLLKKIFPSISYGRLILAADISILIFAGIVYQDLWSVLYSAISVWLSTTVIDSILNGADRAKCVHIVTTRKQEVLERILKNVNRGVTVLSAEGGYTREKKNILLVVVRKYELFLLKQTVHETDPEAFMIVSDASEVVGRGFREAKKDEK